MNLKKWLVINYNLPTEPSRLRVATWRKLKKLGAVNMQQSMWALPESEDNHLALGAISKEIEENGGESLLMESVFFYSNHEERIISSFNTLRDEEYKEFISECEKYLKEIEKEINIEKFTFAELEEEEEELEKLKSWYVKIKLRDIFNASKGKEAEDKLMEINRAFESYSNLVYEHENE